MNRKLAAARALVRNSALPLPERRRQLNQLTVRCAPRLWSADIANPIQEKALGTSAP